MNRYKKGADFERKIVNSFRKGGHYSARIAGSHTGYDVIVITKEKKVLLIQCKNSYMSPKERKKAWEKMQFKEPMTCVVLPCLWIKDQKYFWDADRLKEEIDNGK